MIINIENDKKYFVMMVGLPGSGKSTYSNEFVDKNFVRMSTDSYIESVAKEYGRTYNDMFHTTIKEASRHMHNLFKDSIKSGKNIILDRTNLTKTGREKFLKQIPASYTKICIYVDCDYNTIKNVNHDRQSYGRAIPESIISDMIKSFTIPSLDEDFDVIVRIKR